jgi:hypothetical protein
MNWWANLLKKGFNFKITLPWLGEKNEGLAETQPDLSDKTINKEIDPNKKEAK